MKMERLERVLDECLEDLARGQTVEQCLARHPDLADQLRPMLLAAARLRVGRALRPPVEFRQRAQERLLGHLQAPPSVQLRPRRHWGLLSPGFRLAGALVVLVILLLTFGTLVAQAAQPGDALYGWKLTSEHIWRALQPDPLAADLVLAERRRAELVRAAGDPVAEPLARAGYQSALMELEAFANPAQRQAIQAALVEHKRALEQAGLSVPLLDEMLSQMPASQPPGEATPAATPLSATNTPAGALQSPDVPTPAPDILSTLTAPQLPLETPLPARPSLEGLVETAIP